MEHDCILVSTCCGATVIGELYNLIGFCGSCRDHANFECEEADCEVNDG